jgi:hypothetical protein
LEDRTVWRCRRLIGFAVSIVSIVTSVELFQSTATAATCPLSTFVDPATKRVVAKRVCLHSDSTNRPSPRAPTNTTNRIRSSSRTPRPGNNSSRTNTSRTTNAATRNQTTRSQATRNQATRTVTTRPVVPLGRGDYRYVNGRLLYFPNQLSTSRYNVVGPLPASVAPTTPAARRNPATPTPTPRTPTPRTPTVVGTPIAPIDPFQLATETLEQHPLPPPEPHIPPFQAIAGVPLELTINGATEPTFQLLAATGDPDAADPITYACNPASFDINWGDGEHFTTERRALHTHIWQNRGRADLTITANWTCQYRIESTLQTGTLTTSTQFTQPIPVREVQPVLIDAP